MNQEHRISRIPELQEQLRHLTDQLGFKEKRRERASLLTITRNVSTYVCATMRTRPSRHLPPACLKCSLPLASLEPHLRVSLPASSPTSHPTYSAPSHSPASSPPSHSPASSPHSHSPASSPPSHSPASSDPSVAPASSTPTLSPSIAYMDRKPDTHTGL